MTSDIDVTIEVPDRVRPINGFITELRAGDQVLKVDPPLRILLVETDDGKFTNAHDVKITRQMMGL